MPRWLPVFLVLTAVVALDSPASAAGPAVTVRGPSAPVEFPAGGEAVVRLTVEMAQGYHVYAPNASGYIPLSFKTREAGLEVRSAKLPPPRPVRFEYETAPIPVFDGTIAPEVILSGGAGWAPGPRTVELVVGFQACTEQFCEDPKEVAVEVPVEVVAGRRGGGTGAGGGTEPSTSTSTGTSTSTAPGTESGTGTGAALGGSGARAVGAGFALWQVLGALLAGLLVTLTPCVYPVIPVTITYFQQQGGTRAKAAPLALAYGAGIIAMYATLGVVMARLGRDLGSILGNVYVGWAFVALFILLALSMFGWYELRLPSSWATRLQGGERGGALGALLLGLTLGLVAAPCVGPVAGGLMLIVAQTGDLLFGIAAFGSFGLGIALPFMVLGVFSSGLSAIPRAGEWMDSVKHVFGYLLLAFAVYFVYVASGSDGLTFTLAGAWLLAAGVAALRSERVLARAAAIALMASGLYFLFGPYVLESGGPIVSPERLFRSKIDWREDHDAALALARAEGKPAVVDFTARWCNACHELDLTTFRDKRVVAEMGRFVPIKVDVTRDERNQRIKTEVYKAYKIPFLAFYDSRGRYVTSLPREGANGISTEDVLNTLKEIR